jgi:hypothetical protein
MNNPDSVTTLRIASWVSLRDAAEIARYRALGAMQPEDESRVRGMLSKGRQPTSLCCWSMNRQPVRLELCIDHGESFPERKEGRARSLVAVSNDRRLTPFADRVINLTTACGPKIG